MTHVRDLLHSAVLLAVLPPHVTEDATLRAKTKLKLKMNIKVIFCFINPNNASSVFHTVFSTYMELLCCLFQLTNVMGRWKFSPVLMAVLPL